MHSCKQERVLDLFEKKLDSIDKKLDTVLQYKWAITGGSAVVAFAVSVLAWLIK